MHAWQLFRSCNFLLQLFEGRVSQDAVTAFASQPCCSRQMAELASDWGFQPFGETAEYPAWDLTHGDDAGKRAQKTDKRRQRQLEALVSGVVKLTPAPAGKKTCMTTFSCRPS